jgi:hypothetical protein
VQSVVVFGCWVRWLRAPFAGFASALETICAICVICGYSRLMHLRRVAVAFLLLGGCWIWWLRFSAGAKHIRGLMCHVGLATAQAAWNPNGGENKLPDWQWLVRCLD